MKSESGRFTTMKIGRAMAVRLDNVQRDLRAVDVRARGFLLSWRRWAIVLARLDQTGK